MNFDLNQIQAAIRRANVDGWLFYDFQGSDPIARRILGIDPQAHLTRRWFYYVPASGTPRKLSHKIEPASLNHLPGEQFLYAGWRELEKELSGFLKGTKKVAMAYSPKNGIPYVSRVDAGTIESVRATGVEVVTAADLIQQFEAVWTEEQLQSHIRASKALRRAVDETFEFVAKTVTSSKPITEYDVQQFVCERYAASGLISDTDPIAAVGPNAGNPHYGPIKGKSEQVKKGDLLLIDIWAKEKAVDSVYADITWTCVVGKEVPAKVAEVFDVVRGGRDASLELVRGALASGRVLQGYEVDDAARNYISGKGYGDYFFHRTGHNIGLAVHGNGANMDNYETREERTLLPKTCFSIEPGVYLPEFGIRSEIDVYITDREAHVYSDPIQTKVVPILR